MSFYLWNKIVPRCALKIHYFSIKLCRLQHMEKLLAGNFIPEKMTSRTRNVVQSIISFDCESNFKEIEKPHEEHERDRLEITISLNDNRIQRDFGEKVFLLVFCFAPY